MDTPWQSPMTEPAPPTEATPAASSSSSSAAPSTAMAVAGIASLGAGAIHAVAIGVHGEPRQMAYAFTAVAVAQLAFGALALVRGGRAVATAGVLVSGAALGGWLMAKTTGIGFIDGFGEAEPVEMADGVAALLAAVAFLPSVRELIAPGAVVGRPLPRPTALLTRSAVGIAVVGLSIAAMIATSDHDASGHSHGDEAAAGHSHGDVATGADHEDGDDHEHSTSNVPSVVYDPTQPLNFSGVDGVSPEQQAAAENLVALTLARLPQFADASEAEAQGWSSIGDGFTGHEHLIKWDLINDDKVLDPDYPESLVYDTSGGGRRLVSAMFMLPQGSTLDDVPELGGALTQWHIHDDLCFTPGENPRVAGITSVGGTCPNGLQKLEPVPMIHVWIEPHPCGPFAALEGVAAGQVREGETHLCDHVHGGG